MAKKERVADERNLFHGLGKSESMLLICLKRFKRNHLAIIGLIVLIFLILMSICAPLIAPYDPRDIDLFRIQESPSRDHLLGTDELGRDVLSRLLYGSQVTLLVGISAMLISIIVGSILGAIAGYYGGIMDNIIMRMVDIFLSFPTLFLLIILAAYIDTSIFGIIIIIGITSWMGVARLVRGEFLSLKEKEFVEASKALGVKDSKIIIKHIMPNAMAPLIVAATLGVGYAILYESSLSFLGVGIKAPAATWGNMLSNAQQDIFQAPWLAIWPGLMIFITILAINFVGDGLRDALDPKLN